MNIIENNPYRILGVFVNSPTKERVANQTKLKAFLKVGKAAVFLLDLPQVLPSIVRSQEMVAGAEAKLTLPADQLKYAQFWFVKATPLDEIAFKHLYAGNMEGAIDIWSKKADLYSLQNRLVCALIKKDYGNAIRDAELLYSRFSNAFVEVVVGTNSPIDANKLAFLFLDVLCNEIPTDNVLPFIKNETWRMHVSSTVTKPIIDALLSAVDKAHAVRGKGAQKRHEAGKKLVQEAKPLLIKLGQLLAPENLQYQMVADKVGLEVLQCGIDYFNESEDADAVRNAMILQEFALQTVVGKMAKDRCKENVDTLKKIGPEHIVLKELTGLSQLVKKLDVTNKGVGTYNSINEAFSIVKQFIEESNSHLIPIKEKLGRENKLYISTSSVIATSAVNAIVTILNREQLIVRNDKYKLRTLILSAVKLMYMVGNFDMDNRTNEYYSRNKDALVEMDNATDPNSVSEGCYIATMAYRDYNHPQVLVLREFRDLYLDKRGWGKKFIKTYYKYSPRLAGKLKDYTLINKIIRKALDCFIFCIKNKYTKE
ncbi:MAG: CFI-box-CTERM domain-containing protein [Prevotella conceptionensis]